MKQKSKKRSAKVTLKQVVKADHAAGARVEMQLTPKEVDIEPLRQMSIDLDAIYNLARSRSLESIRAARQLARRVEFNAIQFKLMELEQEYLSKPVMERPS